MRIDLFDIIRDKSFDELTSNERDEIQGIAGDRETYNEIKGFLSEVNTIGIESPIPSIQIKDDLDNLFDEVHHQRIFPWYMTIATILVPRDKPLYQMPLLYVAAILFLTFLIVPIANRNLTENSGFIAQNESSKWESDNLEKDELKQRDRTRMPINEDTGEKRQAPVSEEIVNTNEETQSSGHTDLPIEDEYFRETETIAAPIGNRAMSLSVPARTSLAENHPDGIFKDSEGNLKFSIPASKVPELLDLLTTTF